MVENFDSNNNFLNSILIKNSPSNIVKIKGEEKNYDKEEYNELTYFQALQNDKRNLVEIFFSIFKLKIDIFQIIFYPEEFTHFSILFSCYFFELLIDLTLNVLLFSDDVISQKYFNNGNLLFITTITISLLSNIFSTCLSYYIGKLINYNEILKIISDEVKDKKMYYLLFLRYSIIYQKEIILFFIIIFIIGLGFTYYIFIFTSIYKNMEKEIWKNYFYGIIESLLYKLGISIIITILRKISLSCRYKQLYVVSQFIDTKF